MQSITLLPKKTILFTFLALILPFLFISCHRKNAPAVSDSTSVQLQQDFRRSTNPLTEYVYTPDDAFEYEVALKSKKPGYTLYVVRMVSQRWLDESEVTDPVWWHWVTVVVPDGKTPETGMLFISGGNRQKEMPTEAGDEILQIALHSNSVVASIHNVPNQATVFVKDDYGPRKEDELIAYGWRRFMEAGGGDENAEWMARLPMTKAAVRAMDVISDLTQKEDLTAVQNFVIAGASKRGWTTWTTGAADKRVVAIAPIVIDLLNVIPSFKHHWRAYGRWADAIYDYNHEGIMDWLGSKEFESLVNMTDPYVFIDQLTIPKLILNAGGDQFFLPDSWQFYWDDLKGEKHLRYIPNTEHSMRGSDIIETLGSFYLSILADQERPDFEWHVKDGITYVRTDPKFPPAEIKIWKAHNPEARNFQVPVIGKSYEAESISLREDGNYTIRVEEPEDGWLAYIVELTFPGRMGIPLKLTTGTVVLPDVYPFEPFESKNPRGSR